MKQKLKCSFCEHEESQKWRIKQHIRVSHFGEKLYPCHLCAFSADGRRRLVAHLRDAHSVGVSKKEKLTGLAKKREEWMMMQQQQQQQLQYQHHLALLKPLPQQ